MTLTIWRNSGQVCCLAIGNCIFFFIIWQEFPFSCTFFSSSKDSNSCSRQEKDRDWWPRTKGYCPRCHLHMWFISWLIFFCYLAGKEKHWVACSLHPWPFFDLDSPSPNIFLRVMHSLLKFVSFHLARCIADCDAPAEWLVTWTLESNLIILNNQFCYLLSVWP